MKNVERQIGTSEGISHAIDRKLDADFKTDVKLNLSQWNTIFDIVKNDKATVSDGYKFSADLESGKKAQFKPDTITIGL